MRWMSYWETRFAAAEQLMAERHLPVNLLD
jgi:hypothetical protein